MFHYIDATPEAYEVLIWGLRIIIAFGMAMAMLYSKKSTSLKVAVVVTATLNIWSVGFDSLLRNQTLAILFGATAIVAAVVAIVVVVIRKQQKPWIAAGICLLLAAMLLNQAIQIYPLI